MPHIITPNLSPDVRRQRTSDALKRYPGIEESEIYRSLYKRYGEPVLTKGYGLEPIAEQQVKVTLAAGGSSTEIPEGLSWFIITTDQVDRANDRVIPAGMRIRNFASNPVILWSHDNYLPAIGRGERIIAPFRLPDGRTAILLGIRFQNVTQIAREVAALVQQGFIRTGSVGFIPLDWTDEPVKNYPDAYPFTDTVRSYIDSELLEFSPCNIPMNPGAEAVDDLDKIVSRAVQEGVIAPDAEFINAVGLGRISAGAMSVTTDIYAFRTAAESTAPVIQIEEHRGTAGGLLVRNTADSTIPLAIYGDESFIDAERKATIEKIEAGTLVFRDINGDAIPVESLYFKCESGEYRSLATGEPATPPECWMYGEVKVHSNTSDRCEDNAENDPAKSLLTHIHPDMNISELAEKAGLSVEQFQAAIDVAKEANSEQRSFNDKIATQELRDKIWEAGWALSSTVCDAMEEWVSGKGPLKVDNLLQDHIDAANHIIPLIKSLPVESSEEVKRSIAEWREKIVELKAGQALAARNKARAKLIHDAFDALNKSGAYDAAKALLEEAGYGADDENKGGDGIAGVDKAIEGSGSASPDSADSIAEHLEDLNTDMGKMVGMLAELLAHVKPKAVGVEDNGGDGVDDANTAPPPDTPDDAPIVSIFGTGTS